VHEQRNWKAARTDVGADMRYTPVGECIYCGEKDVKLTDEHVIAYALGGDRILQKASCETCQMLTSEVERAALHDMLIQVRAQLGLPSRNKSLPDKIPLVVHYGDERKTFELEKAEHPTMAIFLLCPLPGALGGDAHERGLTFNGTQLYQVGGPPLKEVLDKLGTNKVSYSQTFKGNEFEKMLAKIALAFAVAERGIEGLRDSPLRKTIRGDVDDAGKWIGSGQRHPDSIPHLHQLMLTTSGDWVVASVRLFANLRAPEYLVVVRPGHERDRPTFPQGSWSAEPVTRPDSSPAARGGSVRTLGDARSRWATFDAPRPPRR